MLWSGPLVCLLFTGCGDSAPTEPPTPLIRESAHFRFVSTTANATTPEIETGIQQAETHYTGISGLVGAARMPGGTITVYLEGDKIPDRSGGYVDGQGAVHLYRYRPDLGGYFGILAHELVHAVRYEYWLGRNYSTWDSGGFIEEGFAEYVAQQVHPEKLGFPFYGFPEDVVAGHRLILGEIIPFRLLRERHEDLNTPCEWQTYPQRASWFRFLDETFGREAVLEIAYSEVETTNEMMEALLGTGLEQVDADWEVWLLARYAAIPDAAQIAAAYWARFGNERTCRAGVDY